MPLSCPFGLIPFFTIDACDGCPQFDSERDMCHWFFPPRPIVEILDTEERLSRLERLYSGLKSREKVTQPREKPQLEAHRPLEKPQPKPAEGVKL